MDEEIPDDFLSLAEGPFPIEENDLIRGWPGFRTRNGRTGLDYVDTYAEMGHMGGVGMRQLITGSWLDSPDGIHPLSAVIVASAALSYTTLPILAIIVIPVGVIVRWIRLARSKPENPE